MLEKIFVTNVKIEVKPANSNDPVAIRLDPRFRSKNCYPVLAIDSLQFLLADDARNFVWKKVWLCQQKVRTE